MNVPRADVEVDVDMESFGDLGAYMWGCCCPAQDVGEPHGYRAFATWEPLPCRRRGPLVRRVLEWLTGVRLRARARGLSFRAYCYNELAENRWLLVVGGAVRGQARHSRPLAQVQEFITSDAWFDLFGIVREQFLCAHGKGLKTIAPVAGFRWRDPRGQRRELHALVPRRGRAWTAAARPGPAPTGCWSTTRTTSAPPTRCGSGCPPDAMYDLPYAGDL